MKLEHLAPYLPYGAKVTKADWGKILKMDCDGTTLNCVGIDFVLHTNAKLVLRPLSDLTEEMYYKLSGESKEKKFGFWYGKYNGDSDKRDFIFHSGYSSRKYFICDGYHQFSYKMMEFFFKNKFDIFGLIEKGEAIDINTLN